MIVTIYNIDGYVIAVEYKETPDNELPEVYIEIYEY